MLYDLTHTHFCLLNNFCAYFWNRLVEFKTKAGAGAAIRELNESMLDGRKLYLKKVSVALILLNIVD